MSLDPAILGRTMEAYLAHAGAELRFHDRATKETHHLPFAAARDPAGLLPVFLVAGEAVWREATGKGFALDIRPDPQALLGRRLHAVGSGTFATVMLSAFEAASQVATPKALLVNDLRVQWAASIEHVRAPGSVIASAHGATP